MRFAGFSDLTAFSGDRAALTGMNDTRIDAVIVGGGPGGLAVSQQLGARNIANLVLERGDRVGWMWDKAYESLRLHTGKHLSSACPACRFHLGHRYSPRGNN